MKSKYKTLVSNAGVFAIGNVLTKLISLFLMPLYTIMLTTEQYGTAELLNNAIDLVFPLATLCIIEALFRFSVDDESDHCVLYVNSLIIVLIGNIVVGFGCLVVYCCFSYQYISYFLLLFTTITFNRLNCQFARGLGHVKRFALYGVIETVILVLSNIFLLVILKGGVGAYLFSFSLGRGIVAILAFILSEEYRYLRFRSFDWTRLREMLKYSAPTIPNMISWWINNISDRYIVLYYLGSSLAGLYTAAGKLPAVINLMTTVFQQAWEYSAAKEITADDRTGFFSNVIRAYVFTCISICCVIIIFNKSICTVLLQSEFYVAWRFVPLLLLAATLGCIVYCYGTFYNAVKDNRMLMLSALLGALLNIALNFLLIPWFGGIGAATATFLSYLTVMIIRIVDVRRIIKLNVNYVRFSIQISCLIVSAIAGCFEGALSIVMPIICLGIVVLSDHEIIKYCVNLGRDVLWSGQSKV